MMKMKNSKIKIKVTVNDSDYYDAVLDQDLVATLGPDPTPRQIAQYDKEQFVLGNISWDDLFDRDKVEFEGIDNG